MDSALRARVRQQLVVARQQTLRLIHPLSRADLHDQFVPFLGPLVWDVGHIANFEELWLLGAVAGRPSTDSERDRLYDPGQSPRPQRGALPLPDLTQTLPYVQEVRREALEELDRLPTEPDRALTADGFVYRMVAQHEQQHQETMLQALDLRADLASYRLDDLGQSAARHVLVNDTDRVVVPAGRYTMGTDTSGDAYDNERPAHLINVDGFALDRFPVTTRRFAQFVAAHGYQRRQWWSAAGRKWLEDTGHTAPQGWRLATDGQWQVRRFGQLLALDPREPVQHISWFEADAFARWAGGRLPTEAEWEKAAAWDPSTRRARIYPWGDEWAAGKRRANVGLRQLGPLPVGAFPGGASAYGSQQMAGDVYEWTSSPFLPYPGFSPFPYPEYSEVFFGGDYRVLRGSSWANSALMARCTYRNWDHPYRRQLFAGTRVAWDIDRRGRQPDVGR